LNVNDHLLVCLAEEAGEVTQAATKALRFGLTDRPFKVPTTNAERILCEVHDLLAVYEMLQERGLIQGMGINRALIEAKKRKVLAMMDHARDQNALEPQSEEAVS
jgi:hypothetical protein